MVNWLADFGWTGITLFGLLISVICYSSILFCFQSWDSYFSSVTKGLRPSQAFQSPPAIGGGTAPKFGQRQEPSATQTAPAGNVQKIIRDHLSVQSIIRAYQVATWMHIFLVSRTMKLFARLMNWLIDGLIDWLSAQCILSLSLSELSIFSSGAVIDYPFNFILGRSAAITLPTWIRWCWNQCDTSLCRRNWWSTTMGSVRIDFIRWCVSVVLQWSAHIATIK